MSLVSGHLELPLTQGKVALIDAADFALVSARKWCVVRNGSKREHLYATACFDSRRVYLHRLIMSPPAGMQVDHINRDTLDNRRANLRICTPATNSQNRRTSRPGRYRGVFFQQGSFVSKMGNDYLGAYATAEEAALAYNRAATRTHGPHAAINAIDPAALKAALNSKADQLRTSLSLVLAELEQVS